MTIQAKISGLAVGGALVGEVITPGEMQGKRAFIRFACPGEIVEAQITKDEKRYFEADLVNVLAPSTDRISPPCKYFTTCGGCQLQHMSINAQREAKRAMIESTIRYHAGMTPKWGVIDASQTLPDYGYRARALFHLSQAGELGFFQGGTRTVIDIDSCAIVSARINSKLKELRSKPDELRRMGQKVAGVIIEEHGEEVKVLLKDRDRRTIESDDGDLAGHFSQVNPTANAALIEIVKSKVPGGRVTELYAGAGNFGLPLAQAGCSVDAVELDPVLVAHGKSRSGNLPITFFESSCEKFVKKHPLHETVVLDPPRSGAKDVVKYLRPHTTHRVVYVSCSLATLTRDLKILGEAGYQLNEVFLVDMFPQTHHIETISTLERTPTAISGMK